MERLFDTHAHLLDERFDADRESVLAALCEQGISHVMEACCEEADIDRIVALVAAHPMLYGSAGVHPHAADTYTVQTEQHIERALQKERIVAVGEIGLDYHYDFSPRAVQRDCFDAQLALANRLNVPVILHDREAHGDCMDLLRLHKNGLKGIMHCYSGSYEMAKQCVDLGLYIAFGGALTFKNAVHPIETASKLPLNRLLLETDCPYMTPVPYRGRRNEPSLMRLTFEKLCAIRTEPREQIAETLFQNSLAVFQLQT